MRKWSFRTIITFALILVIGSVSFTAFYLYGNYIRKNLYDEAERNLEPALELLKDQLYYTIEEHDGSILGSLILRMKSNPRVLNSYLFDNKGNLKDHFHRDSAIAGPIRLENLSTLEDDIFIEFFHKLDSPFSRAYITMENSPICYECHDRNQKNIGYVVIDIAMDDTRSSITDVRVASLLSTLAMVFIIIGLIIFLHYNFVRKSLRDFHGTISSVNRGDLGKRLSIPETKELGVLGKNFNEMLDTLQRTQNELKDYHKKELRNKYKLATIGEMSARLAHEIRNPLTGIANASEIMADLIEKDENKQILEEIQRQAKRANNAINDLLKYSRKKGANLSMNNISDVIESVVQFLNNQNTEKKIEVKMDIQPDIPILCFDNEQMEDVLLNLGINASHAIEESGSITFKTIYKESDEELVIYVTDTGKGIPEENLSRIFHPFFTTRNAGTGLGLAIVKDIIDTHKGEIRAENNESGGCTFIISLPMEKNLA